MDEQGPDDSFSWERALGTAVLTDDKGRLLCSQTWPEAEAGTCVSWRHVTL